MHGREQLANQQRILGEFGAFALQSEDLDAVLHKACELVAEAVGTRRAKILEIEPGGETLFVRAGVGWTPDVVGDWTWSSPQWSAFTGQSEADSRGLGWLEKIHPDDRGAAMAAWQSAERRGAIDVEYRLHHRSEDRYRWFRTRAAPVRDRPDGPVKEWLGTSTDIDDLRRMQDQQQVMVAELQHRTRNLIAVVHSIARLTARTIDDMGEFQRQFSDRLTALSRVQGLLSKSDTTPIEIGDLVAMELDALGIEMGERVEVEGPPVALRSGVVQTLALAIHELATNARK